MNLVFELLVGAAAGAHISTWGMYKDSIHEGFTVPRYLRSTFVGLFWAPVAARFLEIDAAAPPRDGAFNYIQRGARLRLLGLAGAGPMIDPGIDHDRGPEMTTSAMIAAAVWSRRPDDGARDGAAVELDVAAPVEVQGDPDLLILRRRRAGR